MTGPRDCGVCILGSPRRLAAAVAALTAFSVLQVAALPSRYGDLDIDGRPTAADVVRLVNHLNGSATLPAEMIPFADADRDGDVDADDVNWIVNAALGIVGLWGVDHTACFAQPTTTLLEGTANAEIVIELSSYTLGTSVAVEVVPEGTTATEGLDYTPIPATVEVVIDRAVIPISIPDDSEREGYETIELQITAVNGFDVVLPTRHVVLIEDNDRLWRGVLSFNGGAFNNSINFEKVLINNGGALSGVLLGGREPSFPDGQWPMNVTFTPHEFEAQVTGIPAPGGAFFGAPLERGLKLTASPESINSLGDTNLYGVFEETFASGLAPHLKTTTTGTFGLIQTADPEPAIAPEEQDVVTGASRRQYPTHFASIIPVSSASRTAARSATVIPRVPQPIQDATRAIRGNWVNELRPGGVFPPPEGVLLTAGGHVSEPGTAPGSPSFRLTRSGIGHPVGRDMPHPNFVQSTLTRVRDLLYYDPDVSQGNYNTAAFRYLARLYTRDNPASPESLRAQFETMKSLYGPAERARAEEAERLLRDALKHQPLSRELRHALLDLICDRARAELILARNARTEAIKQRLFPTAVPGQNTITNEIAAFEELFNPPGASPYDNALAPFGELVRDRMGVLVSGFDPPEAATEPPFGCYLFQREEPSRSQYAAQYLLGGELTPVIDTGGQPLFAGHKDLVVLFEILTDQAQSAVELARLYAMRATGSDVDDAKALIRETLQETRDIGTVLLGLFPDYEPAPNDASGLAGALAAWRAAMTELEGMQSFLEGEVNMLGYNRDFVMLVRNSTGAYSFNTLSGYMQENANAPLPRAVSLHAAAQDRYDAYRGYEDQLATEYERIITPRDDRLYQITGARYPAALTTDPFANVGSEMNIQWLSVQVAQNRIRRNAQELENLHGRIENIVALWAAREAIDAALIDLHITYGNKRASVQEKIGAINAAQAFADEMCAAADAVQVGLGIPPSVTVSGGATLHVLNAFLQAGAEVGKGFLQGDLEQLAGQEQAGVVSLQGRLASAEMQREVNDILLEMRINAIDSVEAALLLAQEEAKLTALHDEANDILAEMRRESQMLSDRYFADPVHQIRYQANLLDAEEAFRRAQEWAFFMAQAFDFKWNTPFTHGSWSTDDVFRVRNASELEPLIAAMDDKDFQLGSVPEQGYESWISLRQHIFHESVAEFRQRLADSIDDNGNIVLVFSTAREIADENFFLGPVGDPAHGGTWRDKIDSLAVSIVGAHSLGYSSVTGFLGQGGTQRFRNETVGTPDPTDAFSEFRDWSAGHWFRTTDEYHPWAFTDALRGPITMALTTAPHVLSTYPVTFFRERSVAATDWTLEIRPGDPRRLLTDEVEDIEIHFDHIASFPRLNP